MIIFIIILLLSIFSALPIQGAEIKDEIKAKITGEPNVFIYSYKWIRDKIIILKHIHTI